VTQPVWSLSEQALTVADSVYYETLKKISVEDYGKGVLTEPGSRPAVADRIGRELYSDSLFDLHRLLEEIRFEIAFARMLTADYRAHRQSEAQPSEGSNGFDLSPSIEILAVLSSHTSPPPSPSLLTRDLHHAMSGDRHLSRWLAGQLLDSALLRTLSALDRVATMLHIRAGLNIPTRKDGSPRLPAFGKEELRAIRLAFADHEALQELRALAAHDLYRFVKRYRDGTVHHRRWPSELHGEATLAYWDAGAPRTGTHPPERRYEGLTAAEHVAMTLATWNLVLLPAVHAGGRLLSAELSLRKREGRPPDQ
jgi:hypothetical protein